MIASLFRLVLSCCLSRRSKELDIPDDRSRLIPAMEPPLNDNSHVVVVDHQTLKQRLGTIVRSKEGQMVNVTSRIPFNLHNKPLPALDPSSSSRSASASTTRESQSPVAPTRHNRKVRIHSPLQTTPRSGEASPTRSHSVSSSRSLGEGGDADDLEEREPHRSLNVRLVRGWPNGYGAVARRGRALVKGGGGRVDETLEREDVKSADRGKGKEGVQDVPEDGQAGLPPDGNAQVESGGDGDGAGLADPGPASPDLESFINERSGPQGQNDEDSDQNTPTARFCPPLHILPPSRVNFRIHDMGAITLNFGD